MVEDTLSSFLYNELKSKLGVQHSAWVKAGVDCEILKVGGKDWKKGKLKFELSVNFYPVEPDEQELLTSNKQEVKQAESPLDDIRLTMEKLS